MGEPKAIGYTEFFSRSHAVVIHVYDEAGNLIETHTARALARNILVAPGTGSRKERCHSIVTQV
jgi:hypothetical protein